MKLKWVSERVGSFRRTDKRMLMIGWEIALAIALTNQSLARAPVAMPQHQPQPQSKSQPTQQSLSLSDFKKQVMMNDPSWASYEKALEGATQLRQEFESLRAIQVFSQANYLNDMRPTSNPNFQGTKTENTGFLLGLQQQTNFGIKWSISQNYSHTHIFEAALTAIPVPDYYDSYPKLEVSIPLWRNIWGREIQAMAKQTEKLGELRQKQAEISRLAKESEIEMAFFNVVAQQRFLEIQIDGINRSQRIMTWTQGRVGRNLADKSDIIQAQAAVASRRLELISVQKRLEEANRKFNSLRGSESSEVNDKLKEPELELRGLRLSKSDRKIRKDLAMLLISDQSNQAQNMAAKEKHQPQLDLSLSMLKQGRAVDFTDAQSNTYKENKDYFLVLLNFSMPLNQSKESSFREGYDSLQLSQGLSAKGRGVDQQLDWNRLVDQADQFYQQISIVRELEILQKTKADSERDKFNRGRSTTFQVISYEQDYLNTRSQRISLELQIRQFLSQLSQYE